MNEKQNMSKRTTSSATGFLSMSLSLIKEYGNTEIHMPSTESWNSFFKACNRVGNTEIPMPDFIKTCIRLGNTEITLQDLNSFFKACAHYGNAEIPMPNSQALNDFVEACSRVGNLEIRMPKTEKVLKNYFQIGKQIINHCMTEKVNDSEDMMKTFFHYMKRLQIKLNSRMKFLVRVEHYLTHGRQLCISTQCLQL